MLPIVMDCRQEKHLPSRLRPNQPKLKKEYENYKKVASGAFKGRFVKLIDFLPVAGDTAQFSSQSALVVERGSKNLRDYFKTRSSRIARKGTS